MVIFHSYVSLPEGREKIVPYANRLVNQPIRIRSVTWEAADLADALVQGGFFVLEASTDCSQCGKNVYIYMYI